MLLVDMSYESNSQNIFCSLLSNHLSKGPGVNVITDDWNGFKDDIIIQMDNTIDMVFWKCLPSGVKNVNIRF